MNYRVATIFGFLLIISAAGAMAQDTDDVLDFIDSRYEGTADMARTIWEYAEVGYQETRSSALIQAALSADGFEIESGIAGIPTAFVATHGSGGPVIAIMAEFDALPGINQDALSSRIPVDSKTAGHACGHNLFGAGSTSAAIAIRHWLEDTATPGTLRVYGTPAEEGGSGKVYMVRDGQFDDVDIVLHWHASDRNSAEATTTLANRSAKFRFKGVSAHAAGSPEKARSALDGVEAFNHMTNLMREHIPQETRIHYVITAGGNAPNVVPDFAEVFYYLRHPDAEKIKEIWKRIEAAASGAAQGTGTEVEWEIIHGNHSVLVNETLSRMMDEKLRMVGGISYTAHEQEFAEKIYVTLDQPELPLGSQENIQPFTVKLGYHSTDVGDVSMTVPTVGLNTATWVPGTSAHSWQSTAASGMTIGYKGAQVAAKTLTLAAIELFRNVELRATATAEFHERRGEDFAYEALLGNRAPALDYRKNPH